MTEYIPDDLPLLVTESTHISNNTVELIQTCLSSFNISDSYQDPKPDPRQVHRGLELSDISFHSSDDLTLEMIEVSTQRSNTHLVDSNGYSYTMKSHKHSRSVRITWRCILRRNNLTCTATVLQVEDVFTPDSNTHIHPAEPD